MRSARWLVPGVGLAAMALQGQTPARQKFRVEPHDYRFFETKVVNWPATIICGGDVANGAPVRVELVSERELKGFVRGHEHQFLLSLSERAKFSFSQALPEKGGYDILFINERAEPSDVELETSVRSAPEPDVAKYVPPGRRLAAIVISLLVFVAALSASGVKLTSAMKKHRGSDDF